MDGKCGARFTKASGLSAVLGLWLFVCSLMFSPADKLALNGALAGAAITLIGIARIASRETSVAAWTVTLLGSWIAVTPWLLDAASTELRTWHCVIVGALLAVTETVGAVFDSLRYGWNTGTAALGAAPQGQTEVVSTHRR
jgi:hypothetical protein